MSGRLEGRRLVRQWTALVSSLGLATTGVVAIGAYTAIESHKQATATGADGSQVASGSESESESGWGSGSDDTVQGSPQGTTSGSGVAPGVGGTQTGSSGS